MYKQAEYIVGLWSVHIVAYQACTRCVCVCVCVCVHMHPLFDLIASSAQETTIGKND